MKRVLLNQWTGNTDAAFDAFFDQAPIYMISVDADWRVVRVSEFMAEALGYAADEMIGQPSFDFLTPDSQAKALVQVEQEFRTRGTMDGAEYEFRRKDGTALPVVLSAKAHMGTDGRIKRALAVMYDNSEARATQAALRAAIAEAEEASKAKSRFLAAMSHEIRTPMNAILGFTQLLKMSGLDERRQSHVDAIQSAGSTLMKMLNDLLDLSQIETGQLKIARETFDLDCFLEQIADWWQTGATEKGLRMRIAKDQGLPAKIISDRSRIQQVLNNYLANAVKYTREGRITLSVEEVARDGDRMTIRFEVDDTGPGMTQDELAQLFRPFVQVGSGFSNTSTGWGLGLSICHEIATAMEAKVGVQSRPGEGSTFFFELDVGYECADKAAEATEKAPIIVDPEPRPAGLDILVAEDNDMSRALMQDLLTELGHRVTIAENGVHAVNAVKRKKFDLVIMDVMMPHMDGIKATKEIRDAGPIGEVPIIGCSAHVRDQNSYLSAGMDAFLPKPFERTRLEALLSRYSRNHPTGARRSVKHA
ncbi:PAS domain-containing hybrid sensor histidine kinase/response regulator [Meridianimarinicoccus sp. MJW13]|uniref:PAS domain-containing hybrid sensor histidine kinase/response regulator n=1 Tax=Meridianimarinicoccus sp. MJW13 TaxID=2720031 RepID=UPI0018665C42|nr:response regulator [Fluviibacterium sp. MJW13]